MNHRGHRGHREKTWFADQVRNSRKFQDGGSATATTGRGGLATADTGKAGETPASLACQRQAFLRQAFQVQALQL